MEKCLKRKYKKPLIKECVSKNLIVNDSMTIEQLCRLLHNQPVPKVEVPKVKSPKVKSPEVEIPNQKKKIVQNLNYFITKKNQKYDKLAHFINQHFTSNN